MIQEPRLDFLYEIEVPLEPPQPVGETPQGNRAIVYVRGGKFEGPKLRGEVLPGGGDWLLVGPDGVGRLDVRITLRTDDGALIYVTYGGIISAPPEVLGKIVQLIAAPAQAEEVPRDQYYFYSTPYYQTASEKYAWLNKTVAVGVGYVLRGGVRYRVFTLV